MFNMIKIKLIGVNAKYAHTNLAIRSLRAAVAPTPVEITEVTINDILQSSAGLILSQPADIYCFSCYIWNMERVLQLAELIKLSDPGCGVFLGGPEVSYDAPELLTRHPFVDGVFCGEGELAFCQFADLLQTLEPDADRTASDDFETARNQNQPDAVETTSTQNQPDAIEPAPSQNKPDDFVFANYFEKHFERFKNIPGLQLRDDTVAALQIIPNMDVIPFAYTADELSGLKDRILYYESMRGCPFRCAYCLSSTLGGGVRSLSLDRVYDELNIFMAAGVRQVKFVDRTFNVHKPRAKAILKFLAQADTKTNFHFEIAADLLDDEMLAIIATAPKGRFQFEIGIQSTDATTLSAITRKTDLDLVQQRITQLLAIGNSHVHVDLIAGLPHEDFETFKRSYNETMALRPDMLQLGFLKLLKGTQSRITAAQHGYRYASFPPYEVVANNYISAEELRTLKGVEELTELYYNSGNFTRTMNYIFESENFQTPFDFFSDFWKNWCDQGEHLKAHSKENLFAIIGRYVYQQTRDDLIWDLLAHDAYAGGFKHTPKDLSEPDQLTNAECFEIAKDETMMENYFPGLSPFAPKKRVKFLRIHRFSQAYADKMQLAGSVGVFFENATAFINA